MSNTYINIQCCFSQTQQNYIIFIIVLGRHVSILIETSSGPSKDIDPYLKCLKNETCRPSTIKNMWQAEAQL